MARTISAKAQVKQLRFLILRSIFYRQNLPSKLLYGFGSSNVAAEISAMVELKLIRRDNSGLKLTELGNSYLFRISGNRKPPMIDMDPNALQAKEKQKKFIVGSSLAADISRKVRNGE